jgi:hypothetical protein
MVFSNHMTGTKRRSSGKLKKVSQCTAKNVKWLAEKLSEALSE